MICLFCEMTIEEFGLLICEFVQNQRGKPQPQDMAEKIRRLTRPRDRGFLRGEVLGCLRAVGALVTRRALYAGSRCAKPVRKFPQDLEVGLPGGRRAPSNCRTLDRLISIYCILSWCIFWGGDAKPN